MLLLASLIRKVRKNRIAWAADVLHGEVYYGNGESPGSIGSSIIRFLDSIPAQMVAYRLSKRLSHQIQFRVLLCEED